MESQALREYVRRKVARKKENRYYYASAKMENMRKRRTAQAKKRTKRNLQVSISNFQSALNSKTDNKAMFDN